jgi:hypothetical protein
MALLVGLAVLLADSRLLLLLLLLLFWFYHRYVELILDFICK